MSDLWATPNAHDGRRPGSDDTSTQGRNLKREAENFVADAELSNGGGNSVSTPKHTGGMDLEGATELWSTPKADHSYRQGKVAPSEGNGHGRTLGGDAVGFEERWQIPAVDSFRIRGGDRKDEMGLDQQARMLWVTPASRDWKGANSELHCTEVGGGGSTWIN